MATAEMTVMAPRRHDSPVRLSEEAIDLAKKAAAISGMSLSEYASATLIKAANEDLDRFAASRVKPKGAK